MNCPTFETLIDFADERLATESASNVQTHLTTGCDSCQSTISWFTGFASAASADLVEPPVWLTRKAVGLFATRQKEGLVARASRFITALVFDSMAGAASPDFVPARSSAFDGRQLLFSATPFDVDLLVTPGSATRTVAVTGQVLASDSTGFSNVAGLEVALLRNGGIVAETVTSDFGEFSMDSIPPGTYDFQFSNDEREIVVAGAPIDIR